MTTLTFTRPLFSITDKVVDVFKALIIAYREAKAISATVEELSKLSDRELSDMGIHRSQIPGIALAAARGEDYNG